MCLGPFFDKPKNEPKPSKIGGPTLKTTSLMGLSPLHFPFFCQAHGKFRMKRYFSAYIWD